MSQNVDIGLSYSFSLFEEDGNLTKNIKFTKVTRFLS